MATNSSSSPTSVFPSLRRKSVSKAVTAEAKQKRDAAVREAKQYVRDVVRADWSYEPLSNLWTVSSSYPDLPRPAVAVAGAGIGNAATATDGETYTSANAQSGIQLRQPNIAQWRIREPASSESDSDLDPALQRAIERHKIRKGDPYRFESPDAIKASVLERGRRRRADLEQETKWNPGLRFYLERRDAWTGVRKRRDVEPRATRGQRASTTILPGERTTSNTKSSDAKVESFADAMSPAEQSTDLMEDMTLSERKSEGTTSRTDNNPLNEEHGLDGSTGDDGDVEDYDDNDCSFDSDESMIPVMDSFIDTSNPVRSSITPALYASLYSKVIVQGLTPTIPINLADVTKALVAGWKADGQWPPKPTLPPPGSDVPARKKGTKAQSSTKNDDAIATGVVGGRPTNTGRKTSFSNQATSAVKKVLGLSNHSFHLRRSSRSSANGDSVADRSSVADSVPTDVLIVEEDQEHGGLKHQPFGC